MSNPALSKSEHRTSAHDAASADDRAWFHRNPERRHRIRRALLGEGQMHPDRLHIVAVRWFAPDRWIRVGFYIPSPMPAGEAPEMVARGIFEATLANLQCADFLTIVETVRGADQ